MNKKNNIIIPVSGASHSGKTTFINKMKELYPNEIVTIDEVIRNKNINIDEIRMDSTDYLDLEIDIITKKIDDEESINKKFKNKIILTDRSLIDSYFYYTFYTDKGSLDILNIKRYHEFLSFLKLKMYDHVNGLYDFILLFEPISEITRMDEYTVDNIEMVQDNEYFFIKNFTYGVCENQRNILNVNPNIAEVIIKNIIESESLSV